MSWRTLALAACWIAAAGWGIYYLIVQAGSSPAYVVNAVGHFIVGYVLARAIMARPLTMPVAPRHVRVRTVCPAGDRLRRA